MEPMPLCSDRRELDRHMDVTTAGLSLLGASHQKGEGLPSR